MYSASDVDELFDKWRNAGQTKEQLIVHTAEAELGWPYVWGAVAALCMPSKRTYYAQRSACPEAEGREIIRTCQALNGSGKSCGGCKFYPDNMRTQINDCQGFVKQLQKRVGITLSGAGATSMYNDANNWTARGPISEMPNQVCCVFMKSGEKMSHVGQHVGNGVIIHCSGTVKKGKTTDRGWTHYAIPKGLGGDTPMPWRTTIRRGSRGDDVKYCQEILQKLGYDIGASGADGIFGSKTEAAVKAFQKKTGLVADGVVGPMTWEALENVQPSEEKYTVTIRHMTKAQADALKAQYPDAEIKKEG